MVAALWRHQGELRWSWRRAGAGTRAGGSARGGGELGSRRKKRGPTCGPHLVVRESRREASWARWAVREKKGGRGKEGLGWAGKERGRERCLFF